MPMRYKAVIGFSGEVSMSKGEVRELNDKAVIEDLLRCGYIEEADKPKAKKTS